MTNESFSRSAVVKLPQPAFEGPVAVEAALRRRRSVRLYANEPLSLETASQLLWSVQGLTTPDGMRTAPSAGPCYPLETYLVAGNVAGLPAGVYKYRPRGHELARLFDGDVRASLSAAALGQRFIEEAPLSIVLSAVYERTTKRYGERGIRYVHMDAGHAGENLHLQAIPLGLGTVMVGAFQDDVVHRVLRLPAEEHPLYIMPVGRPK
jgi:SagB-type dehydrogenase family enzyme